MNNNKIVVIHNKDNSVIKLTSNCSEAIKIIKQMSTVYDEKFYVHAYNDIWDINNDK